MADDLENEPQTQESQRAGEQAEQRAAEEAEEKETPLKDRIAVDVEDVGVLRKRVKVTVPRQVIDERLAKSYGDLIKQALIPGFRKGRAPITLIQKRFGKDVTEEVRTKLLGEAYEAAVEKAELDILGQPDIDPKAISLPDQGDLEFAGEVEIKPKFELPGLEGIPIKRPKITLRDEDVDREIERLRSLRGQFLAVDEPVQPDDMVVADLIVTAEGQEVRKQEGVTLFARPREIEGMVFQDFGEVITSAKVGEARTLAGTLPDAYEKEELRGKPATVSVTVKEVRRMRLPEMNAEFLKSLGFEGEQELREFIRGRLEGRLDQEVNRAMREQVYGYLLENVKFDLPENLSKRQTDRVVMRRVLQLRNQGVPDAQIDKQMDEMRTRAGEQARNDLKQFFIMNRIAEQLEVDVSEEELNGRIAAIARYYNRRFDRVRDEMVRDGSFESLYLEIRDEKSVDAILTKAGVVEQEPPAQAP